MHAWGADVYPIQGENARPSSTTCPKRAASAAPTRWPCFAGAQHPIAAHLFINFMLDAQISADNTNLIGYMGAERGREAVHRPGRSSTDPTVNPDQATIAKLTEILDLGERRDEYLKRWQRSGADARDAAAGGVP